MFSKLSTALICSLLALSHAQADVASAWSKMTQLAGTWQAGSGEHKMEMTYELVAGGSALLERHMGMVTVYHPDGETLMATHYCSAKNQPRMRAKDLTLKDNTIVFDFVDVTNTKVGENHINGLKIIFVDANTVREEWSYIADGKTATEVFELKRIK